MQIRWLTCLCWLNWIINKKAVILEADVQDYPAMFMQLNQQASYGVKATFAPYPLEEALGGYT